MSASRESQRLEKAGLRQILGQGGTSQNASSQTPVPFSAPIPEQRKRWNGRLGVTIVVMLLLLVIGSGLGTFFWLSHSGPTRETISTAQGKTLLGHAFFANSEKLNVNNAQGINDELQINLSNIPAPASGKNYFAWLLSDKNQPVVTAIFLGKLSVTQGNVHFFYAGNQQHSNLLAVTSRILITEEDANLTPINPSPNASTWRYYAELPQTPDPKDTLHHFSMLDHLRSLLAEDSTIKEKDIHGGLVNQLVRKTEKILEWAGSARDDWGDAKSVKLMRYQFISILDYLDGASFAQADTPPHTPSLVNAPYPILESDTSNTQTQISSDYLNAIIGHMNAIAQAPGGTPATLTSIAHIKTGLENVKSWFEQARLDAKQLIMMTDAQLQLPAALSILDDMYTQAFYAYVGRIDPATNEVQSGIIQIDDDTEHLVTFDVQAYKSSQKV